MGKWAKLGVIAGVVVIADVAFVARGLRKAGEPASSGTRQTGRTTDKALPKLVDLGAGKCIPCKMMAPVLEELKREYVGRLDVVVIDVSQDPAAGERYGIRIIPTQIFYDASGKEFMRHEGFFSKEDILAAFRDKGIDLGDKGAPSPEVVREEPVVADARLKDSICLMCERDVGAKTKVTVRSPAGGKTHLCSPHCYFILESCLVDKASAAEMTATDFATDGAVPFKRAVFLYGADERGRPTIKASASRDAALSEMRASGGSVLTLDALREREYAVRCGFCDRAMYVQDNGSVVQVTGGPRTHGCCPHCALGVAARLGLDITVEYRDPVDGTLVRIETFDGKVKSIEPPTAVAWFGQRKKPDGTFKSAGCFHQWNFASVDNLRTWLEEHPRETGRMITIHKALAAKMKLTPQQIKKACKVGECR
ncbi:MAG: organomercurial lyase, partial [Planctomycetota bacterium]|jgi:thioredoxin 1